MREREKESDKEKEREDREKEKEVEIVKESVRERGKREKERGGREKKRSTHLFYIIKMAAIFPYLANSFALQRGRKRKREN
jgi:hypothetical protein